MLTRGFMSSTEPRLHFGVDSFSLADSILVVWLNQKYELLKTVHANQRIVCRQKDATRDFSYKLFFPERKKMAEDISKQITIGWRHEENSFNDFNDQYLIPHMESTRGPKLAVADINKDGLDDLFVCGAKGQPGCLMIQTKTGGFVRSDTPGFPPGKASGGSDAPLFYAHNHGYRAP